MLHISPTAISTWSKVTPGLSFAVLNSILAPKGSVIGSNIAVISIRGYSGKVGRQETNVGIDVPGKKPQAANGYSALGVCRALRLIAAIGEAIQALRRTRSKY